MLLTRGICFVVAICFLLLFILQIVCCLVFHNCDMNINWVLPTPSLCCCAMVLNGADDNVPGDNYCFESQHELE